jgi:peptidoglycan/xylan/chitin deacetylase (PgdA/CDA1 family)
MNHPGVFCISLDFELHWGCFENMLLTDAAKQYFRNTRDVIPKKLQLFADNGIHVTWASVGMLFNRNQTEWQQNKPALIPTFTNPAVSAYEWIHQHGFEGEADPFHFAPDLIDMILQTPHQELATHTYAHYFCLEAGQTRAQFAADMQQACALAAARGKKIRSLVFPRNQFNEAYLSVCSDLGITAVRSSPAIWYWSPATRSSFLKKFFRAGDAYIKMQPIKPVYLKDIRVDQGLPLLLPSTRLYRPWKAGQPVQNKLKLRRILNEMTEAARSKAYMHLWWHPHNFGNNPAECLDELKIILQHFQSLKSKYGFQSMHMEDIANHLLGSQTSIR